MESVRAVTVAVRLHVAEQRDLAEHVALLEWREAAMFVADVVWFRGRPRVPIEQ